MFKFILFSVGMIVMGFMIGLCNPLPINTISWWVLTITMCITAGYIVGYNYDGMVSRIKKLLRK